MTDYFKNLGVFEAVKKASTGIHPGICHEKSLDDLDIYWQDSDMIFRINFKVSQRFLNITKRLAYVSGKEKDAKDGQDGSRRKKPFCF